MKITEQRRHGGLGRSLCGSRELGYGVIHAAGGHEGARPAHFGVHESRHESEGVVVVSGRFVDGAPAKGKFAEECFDRGALRRCRGRRDGSFLHRGLRPRKIAVQLP